MRPLCGIETFSHRTIHAAFAMNYPQFELLFCVARAGDPVIPLIEAAIAGHPHVSARLLVGDDPISINPKLNNMVKGLARGLVRLDRVHRFQRARAARRDPQHRRRLA